MRIVFKSTTNGIPDIVDGWKANADRYAMDFVSPNHYTNLTTVNNTCAHVKSFHLLVIVTSAIENFEEREGIRGTWATSAKHYPENISILFLVGLSERGDLNASSFEYTTIKILQTLEFMCTKNLILLVSETNSRRKCEARGCNC